MEGSQFLAGLLQVISPVGLLSLVIGTFVGMIVGALPGLGAGIGMTLMLPLVFFWPPAIGLILLVALWQANNYGDSIASILINVPGGAGAVITCIEGYPMAQQGQGQVALGLSMASSAVGGIIGAIAFALLAPPISRFVLLFSANHYFLLVVLAFTVIACTSGKDIPKAVVATGMGFMLGMIGVDLMTGYPRFTFGQAYLLDGFDFQIVMLGVFAAGRILIMLTEASGTIAKNPLSGNIMEGFWLAFKYPASLIRGSVIGTVLGALPGTGISASTALSYQYELQASKHPERFGKGAPEGILGPEAANNAVQGGGLIPTLTMAIPGSSSAAVFLGALMMYGLRPGADIFTKQGNIAWAIFWAMIAAVFAFILMGLLFGNFFAKVATIPINILVPTLIVMVAAGTYAVNTNLTDVAVLVLFGLFGYFMEITKIPLIPFILAYILGSDSEVFYFRALLLSQENYITFFNGPIQIGLWILIVLGILIPIWANMRQKKKAGVV